MVKEPERANLWRSGLVRRDGEVGGGRGSRGSRRGVGGRGGRD